MRNWLFTAMWGFVVWLFATLFFRLFGEYVLFPPRSNAFVISTILLLIGTAAVLWGVTQAYRQFDRSKYAPLKFGVIGTIIGLALDTFSISFHPVVLPQLDEARVIAFTAWLSFAYALYLFIPFMIQQKIARTG
ncbi:MAG: hypothetical protein C6W55_07735 [Thermobacillus sp.]|uniref:DUF5367 family protein n=1 Tax=Thermobacillus sp. TaxID=2108467 RepID=UPI000E3AD2BE|nr:DUF5367 family protein [Thermobacillus sp.]REK56621.1 MAG: hypothetical protein C6W55_07735 [Thermobacillus sp.]